jgi:hypothetical protein
MHKLLEQQRRSASDAASDAAAALHEARAEAEALRAQLRRERHQHDEEIEAAVSRGAASAAERLAYSGAREALLGSSGGLGAVMGGGAAADDIDAAWERFYRYGSDVFLTSAMARSSMSIQEGGAFATA